MQPILHILNPKEIEVLRKKFEALQEVTLFTENLKFASQIASYGMWREIGTVNDELARFVFDANNNQPVVSLKGELVQWNGLNGLKIYSAETARLELRLAGFNEMVHPTLAKNNDGTFQALYIFPEIIQQISAKQGVELVLVKTWGNNSIFGGFDPSKGYYQTNIWEIQNNDVFQFTRLLTNGQIAFLGTHDLIAHIAGIKRSEWLELKKTAQTVLSALSNYFQNISRPSLASLILPYTIGVVLDDLAQPPSYSSQSHLAVLSALLDHLEKKEILPKSPVQLLKFPTSFQKIIELSRTSFALQSELVINTSIQSLVNEIQTATVLIPS